MSNNEFDVIVAGSGAGGLATAVCAAEAGLKTLLLEGTDQFGGTTAYSGGAVWIPANRHMLAAGFDDSKEQADTYLRAVLGSHYDPAKVGAYLDNAPKMIDFLEAKTDIKFRPSGAPDYEPNMPGSKFSRTLMPAPYDGRKLGEHLMHLRPALEELGALGVQVDVADIPHLLAMRSSIRSVAYFLKLIAQDRLQKLKYGRGTRLVHGNGLVAGLLVAAKNRGVTLWRNAPVIELLTDNGKVTGAIVERDGSRHQVRARKAVVLATGGFGANAPMRRQYIPLAGHGWSLQPPGCQGDGIRLGVAAGGSLVNDNTANGIWYLMSAPRKRDGSHGIFLHAFLDRHMPGFIIVDQNGRRFVNEGFHYQHIGDVMAKQNIGRCFLVADHAAVRKWGIGQVRPAPAPLDFHIRSGYLKRDSSLEGLAKQLGVDASTFSETVKAFNEGAEKGVDPQFNRGADAYSRAMGDAKNTPNQSLGALKKAPYYAIELRPGDISTLCGLNTNHRAQVLSPDGSVIPGLYAVGLDMNSVWGGAYPGGGASVGPALTFGFIAAKQIVGDADN